MQPKYGLCTCLAAALHRGRAGAGSVRYKGVTSFFLAVLDCLVDISYLSAGFETKDDVVCLML